MVKSALLFVAGMAGQRAVNYLALETRVNRRLIGVGIYTTLALILVFCSGCASVRPTWQAHKGIGPAHRPGVAIQFSRRI